MGKVDRAVTRPRVSSVVNHVRAMGSIPEILTIGMVSKLCGVANRTASKWCDAGKLPCYRLPTSGRGHGDRRVYLRDLVKFADAVGMEHVRRVLATSRAVLLVGVPADQVEGFRETLTAAGATAVSESTLFGAVVNEACGAVVIGPEVAEGSAAARAAGVHLTRNCPAGPPVLVVVLDQHATVADRKAWEDAGFRVVLPFDLPRGVTVPDLVVQALELKGGA